MISIEKLKKLGRFWTIESRLVDYLGIISRDLGRELSFNEFLSTLAPEFQDPRITPIVFDAHQFSDKILLFYTVDNAEFSREHQQTVIEWRLKTDSDANNVVDLVDDVKKLLFQTMEEKDMIIEYLRELGLQGFYFSRFEAFEQNFRKLSSVFIAPINGDISKVWGINTRIITILNSKSRAAELLSLLNGAILKLLKDKKLNELSILCIGHIYFSIVCKNIHRKEFGYQLGKEIYPKWSQVFSKINIILNYIGIDKQFPENLDDFIKDIIGDGTIFDVSSVMYPRYGLLYLA